MDVLESRRIIRIRSSSGHNFGLRRSRYKCNSFVLSPSNLIEILPTAIVRCWNITQLVGGCLQGSRAGDLIEVNESKRIAGRATSAILRTESRMTMNLMGGKTLLLQATRGPKYFDDVQSGNIGHYIQVFVSTEAAQTVSIP